MSYNFAQMRSYQVKKYLEPLQHVVNEVQTITQTFPGVYFLDKNIHLEEGNTLQGIDINLSQNKYYYLKIKIYRKSSLQNFSIYLTNNNIQTLLKNIKVEGGEETAYEIVDFIIAPENNYSDIKIELNRTTEDYNIINEDGSRGRKVNLEVMQICEVFNIINKLSSEQGSISYLKQIGVQGPSGLKMCIDGEEIRVGKSKIYEINNGVIIKFLGFIIEENDDNQTFILDYQY